MIQYLKLIYTFSFKYIIKKQEKKSNETPCLMRWMQTHAGLQSKRAVIFPTVSFNDPQFLYLRAMWQGKIPKWWGVLNFPLKWIRGN